MGESTLYIDKLLPALCVGTLIGRDFTSFSFTKWVPVFLTEPQEGTERRKLRKRKEYTVVSRKN